MKEDNGILANNIQFKKCFYNGNEISALSNLNFYLFAWLDKNPLNCVGLYVWEVLTSKFIHYSNTHISKGSIRFVIILSLI